MSAERDEARRKAEVMLAFAEGAEVECRDGFGRWVRADPPTWQWSYLSYRVKPKPREAWAVYSDDGSVWTVHNDEDDAHRAARGFASRACVSVVHMREVAE